MAAITAQQMDEIKARLNKRKAQLRNEIRDELRRTDNEHYIDLAGKVHDAGEESFADLMLDVNIAIIDRQVNELQQIEAAERRINSREYGECIDCGDEIGIERLMNYPTAIRCVTCQTHRERTYAHESTPRL